MIIRKLWFAVILIGLLLLTTLSYAGSYGCNNCHSPHGGFIMPTFHTADKLICNKCHTMHASEDGVLPTMPDEPGGTAEGPNPHLLYKDSVTDLCLVCHAGPMNGLGAPIVLTPDGSMGTNYPSLPVGDFYYSKADKGKGHSPGGTIGSDDTTLAQSPGGGFASADETCISCHDPHGGSPANTYRLLKKKPGDWTGPDLLVSAADTPPSHPGTDEKETNAPEYYSGFSEWCGACHSNPDGEGTGFHGFETTDTDVSNGTNWIRHPSDLILGSVIAGNYSATYDWRYPIEDVDSDGVVADTDEVFCLSCHRAHATAYSNSTRWDSGGPSGSGTGCNKCHAKGA